MKTYLLRCIGTLFRSVIQVLPPAVMYDNLDLFLEKLDQYSGSYTQYRFISRKGIKGEPPIVKKRENKVAVVIQGPLVLDSEFTLETVRYYVECGDFLGVIVSTWQGADEGVVQTLRHIGAEVLLLRPPRYGGPRNVNYQIVSSEAGIVRAQELGAEYVIKTRSDQRFSVQGLSDYLITQLSLFPSVSSLQPRSRLIACSWTSLLYRPYGVGDMFMFGIINDMLDYWQCRLDERPLVSNKEIERMSVREYAEAELAEVYLCKRYLEKIGWKAHDTIEDSLQVYRMLFIILDRASIDLFWYKYNWRDAGRFRDSSESTHRLITHRIWLTLQGSVEPRELEQIMDLQEGGAL